MQIKTVSSFVIQIGTLLGLLCLTLMKVEMRWSEADVMLAYAIPVLGVVGLVCLMLNRRAWRWTWIDGLSGGWMVFWLLRVWMGGEFPCATSFLQMSWMCLLYMVLRMVFAGSSYTLLHLEAGLILLFGAYESLWGFWQIISETSRHSMFLLTGNFLNPGPFSAYPMMGAIAGISLLSVNHNLNFNGSKNALQSKVKIMIEVLTLVCLMVLPATWSRAAWVGIGVVALWLFRQKYWMWRWYVWGGLLILAAVAFLMKQGSAEGRLIIWMAALFSWYPESLWGVGYGGFNHACAEGIAALYCQNPVMFSGFHSAGVSELSYNALLQILVEQGIVGAAICITLVVAVLNKAYCLCPPLFYVLVSMLFFSFFSYPLEMLPYRILLTMIVATIVSAQCNRKTERTTHWWKPALVGVLTIAISIPLRRETERRKESDEGYKLISHLNDECFLKDYCELQPDERDNTVFLFDMAKLLQSNGRYNDSNAILRQAIQVSRDPMLYVLMGNNYKSMGFLDRADSAYVRAFQILPNRMYPLYKRMLLQQELGNEQLTSALAKQIVEIRPKIKSPATDEMQEKAREILAEIGK